MANDSNESKLVAVYLRVSTIEQTEEDTPVENQRGFLQAWAKLQGYEVHTEHPDPGSMEGSDSPGAPRSHSS